MSGKNHTHTPGPWYVVETYEDQSIQQHVQSAAINEDNYVCEATGSDFAEAKANAALIAAAPDMLRALKMFAHNYNLGAIQPEDNPQTIVGAIFSAIAKAEGRTE